MEQLYVAVQTFMCEYNGNRHRIVQDKTIVREGHPLMVGREHLFRPIVVHYDTPKKQRPVETATDRPPAAKRTTTRKRKE